MALVLEIVGPAGAGKSTLASALAARLGTQASLSLWGQRPRYLAGGALRALPAALTAALHRQPLVARELSQMARLEAMASTVDRASAGERRAVVLDEGPVFALAWFDVFYGRNGDAGWSAWRRRTVADWASRLDYIVRLDAEPRRLASRIRTRDKNHRVKQWSDAALDGFQGRYRDAFDKVIADMQKAGSVQVLDMRSDDFAPAALAERLASSLTGAAHGR